MGNLDLGSRLRVCLNGTELPAAWHGRLSYAFADTTVGLPAEAFLRFRDRRHSLLKTLNTKIGTPLTLAAVTTAYTPRRLHLLFAGEVTALESETGPQGTFTIIRAMDPSHRLRRGRRVHAYTDTSIKAVVSAAAGRAGMDVGMIETDPGEKLPYLAQPNLTDWEFLHHLAAERGVEVTVNPPPGGKGKSQLSLRRPAPALTAPSPAAAKDPRVITPGGRLKSLHVALTSTGRVSQVEVRGWDPQTKQPVCGRAPAATSTRVLTGLTPSQATKPFAKGDSLLLVTGRPYTSTNAAMTAAKALASDNATAFADLDATLTGAPQLCAGTAVTLTKLGDHFNGAYTITSCRHTFDNHPGSTTNYLTRLRVTPAPAPPVPPAPPLTARGLATAMVTHTREDGQARLQFPWLDPTYVSPWTRIAQFGGTGGGIIPPEIGDEVLVGFEHGRLDHPYIIGGLYNGKDKPSPRDGPLLGRDRKVNRRSLATHHGDRIELLTPHNGTQGIRLTTGTKADTYTALLDRNSKTITLTAGTDTDQLTINLNRSGKTITLTAGTDTDQLTINLNRSSSTITLDAGPNGTLDLKAGTINIHTHKNDASLGLNTKGPGTVELIGKDTLHLQKDATTNIKLDENSTTVKGKTVNINC